MPVAYKGLRSVVPRNNIEGDRYPPNLETLDSSESITSTESHAPESRNDLRCEQHIHTVTSTFRMYIFTIPLCHLGSHLLWPFFRIVVIFFVWDRIAVVLSYLATALKTQAICRHERQDLVPIEEERAT
jgi:hypothetical protein